MPEPEWRRLAPPGAAGGHLEVARVPGGLAVRAAQDPHGPVLRFTPAEIAAFADGARNGEFDDLVGGGVVGGTGPSLAVPPVSCQM